MKYENFSSMLDDLYSKYFNLPVFYYSFSDEIGSITYGDFIKEVRKRRDIYKDKPFNRVGIPCFSIVDVFVDIFAYLTAGKDVVLLYPQLPDERMAGLIASSDINYITSYKNFYNRDFCTDFSAVLSKPGFRESQDEGDVLVFSSGTQSLPHAVVLSTKSLCYSAWNGQQMLPCNRYDKLLSILPISHVFGFVCSFLWPFSQGASIALGHDLKHLMDYPKLFEPTIISVVPSMLRFLLGMNALNTENHLRLILVGAAPADSASLYAVKQLGPEIRFGYGLTETASGVAISMSNDTPFSMKACPDTQIKIASDGEILLKTPCIMKEYYNDKQSTEKAFSDGWFKTGDLGKTDENGDIIINGRKNDVFVLSNGQKINCVDWESMLLQYFPGKDFALVQNGDSVYFVINSPSESYNECLEKIRTFNGKQAYGLSVTKILLCDSPLPRTSTGKVMRWKILDNITKQMKEDEGNDR